MRGELQESLSNQAVKPYGFTVQPVLFALSPPPSGQADRDRDIEQQGEIRVAAVRGDGVGGLKSFEIEPAGKPLIGEGRIGKPVAQDDCTALEGRRNEVRDVLASCREYQQGLGFGCNRFPGR